jgi:hypothetical protein
MREQVIDVVGQQSKLLPLWMLSKQTNGQVLGFTPAWVIAYTNPGQSGQIAYNIETYFGNQLNLIDFEVDRYELDNLLTKNWDRETQQWVPHPPTDTRFDYGSANYNIDPWISDQTLYYNVLTVSGNGTTVTVKFTPQPTAPFSVGQQVYIFGVSPTNYNGNVIVTNCTTSSFTYTSAVSAGTGIGGSVSTLPPDANWINNVPQVVEWTNEYNGEPTVFDGNSLQFIAPVDMYSNTNEYDKYLVFQRNGIPARNILE